MAQSIALSHNPSPRGLSRDAAAMYIGIGVTKLDAMVADRPMPNPKIIDRWKVWDILALNAASSLGIKHVESDLARVVRELKSDGEGK